MYVKRKSARIWGSILKWPVSRMLCHSICMYLNAFKMYLKCMHVGKSENKCAIDHQAGPHVGRRIGLILYTKIKKIKIIKITI
jgi:hypothetical protein